MKRILLAAALGCAALPALADGFMMGSGRWNCGDVLKAWNGEPIAKGQVAGWILGYWSAATAVRETAFVDTVERVGGTKIVEATLAECQKAGPDVLLYQVTQGMIANTK